MARRPPADPSTSHAAPAVGAAVGAALITSLGRASVIREATRRLDEARDTERVWVALRDALRRTVPAATLRIVPDGREGSFPGTGLVLVAAQPIGLDYAPAAAIELWMPDSCTPTVEDVATAEILCRHAALAIRQLESHERLGRQQVELEWRLAENSLLLGVSEELQSSRELRTVLDLIVDSFGRVIPNDSMIIGRVDFEAGVIRPILVQGIRGSLDVDVLPIDVGLSGWAIAHAEPVLTNDAPHDPRAFHLPGTTDEEDEAVIVVPLLASGKVTGFVNVSRFGRDNTFTEHEFEVARLFCAQAAVALENALRFDELERQRRELEHYLQSQRTLLEVNEKLLSTLEPTAVLEAIADSLSHLLSYDSLGVYQADFEAGEIAAVYARAEYSESLMRYRGSLSDGLSGWAIQHGSGLLVRDATADPRATVVPGTPSEEPSSVIVAPIFGDGRAVGTLVLNRHGADRSFTSAEYELTQLFAAQASVALQNAKVFTTLERQQAELEQYVASQRAILEVTERLVSTLDPKAVLQTIGESLRTVVTYDSLAIHRVDEAAGIRRSVYAVGWSGATTGAAIPLDAGIGGWSIAHGEAVLANEANLDPRWMSLPDVPLAAECAVCVPLFVAGRATGCMYVTRFGHDQPFSQREFELVKLFAAQASVALQNAEVHRAIEDRAERDSLTDLRNRGAFSVDLERLVDHSFPFALMMLDLDRFKDFNDTFGHPAGDKLLRSVAAAMSEGVRAGDAVYRYGGDEFAILLPSATREIAAQIADRVKLAIAGAGERGGAPTGVDVGASVGFAFFPTDAARPDELVAIADAALYRAKRSARRRSTVARAHEER